MKKNPWLKFLESLTEFWIIQTQQHHYYLLLLLASSLKPKETLPLSETPLPRISTTELLRDDSDGPAGEKKKKRMDLYLWTQIATKKFIDYLGHQYTDRYERYPAYLGHRIIMRIIPSLLKASLINYKFPYQKKVTFSKKNF